MGEKRYTNHIVLPKEKELCYTRLNLTGETPRHMGQ